MGTTIVRLKSTQFVKRPFFLWRPADLYFENKVQIENGIHVLPFPSQLVLCYLYSTIPHLGHLVSAEQRQEKMVCRQARQKTYQLSRGILVQVNCIKKYDLNL